VGMNFKDIIRDAIPTRMNWYRGLRFRLVKGGLLSSYYYVARNLSSRLGATGVTQVAQLHIVLGTGIWTPVPAVMAVYVVHNECLAGARAAAFCYV